MLFPLLGNELVGNRHEDVLVANCPKTGTSHILIVELLAKTFASLLHPEIPLLLIDGLNIRTVRLFVLHLDSFRKLGLVGLLLFKKPTVEHLRNIGMNIVGLFLLDEFVYAVQLRA